MTWPDGIAAVIGLTTALLITRHQHRSNTAQHTDPQDGTGERP
ncbi:hypothetical protein [Streptomyces sp. NBC_00847]|nr:hypothetical protein [Streptomyces sp. NBC_00847]MCX4885939.1 hypothetical protein [Streptomyces sp. NBC_00847]